MKKSIMYKELRKWYFNALILFIFSNCGKQSNDQFIIKIFLGYTEHQIKLFKIKFR